MSQDPYLRRTTTPIRRRPAAGRFRALPFIAVAIALAIAAWQGLGASGGDGDQTSGAVPCLTAGCPPVVSDVNAGAAAAAPAPCPYCNQDPDRWRALTDSAPPEIGGKTAALIEGSCGSMIFGLSENERRPPASLTKIAGAMVTLERAKAADVVDIRLNGWDLSAEDDSTIMGLEAGMRLTVEDLLYGMLLASGNDAARALADHLGGAGRFVDLMNARVRRLGLENTNFATPDGRDAPQQYSSALDMALLGRELLQDPALRKIVSTQQYQPHWDGQIVWNNNALLYYYEGAVGVKTGYTEQAGYTIVAAAERGGRLLVVSVFGGWHLYLDSIRLLDWAFANVKPSC